MPILYLQERNHKLSKYMRNNFSRVKVRNYRSSTLPSLSGVMEMEYQDVMQIGSGYFRPSPEKESSFGGLQRVCVITSYMLRVVSHYSCPSSSMHLESIERYVILKARRMVTCSCVYECDSDMSTLYLCER